MNLPTWNGFRSSAKLFSGYTFQTDGTTGIGSIALPIPNSFNGLDPAVSNCRFAMEGEIWSANWTAGDQVTEICVYDKNSVLPAPLTGQKFSSMFDPDALVANHCLYLRNPQGGPTLFSTTVTAPPMVPSGCFLFVSVQKAIVSVDTFFINFSALRPNDIMVGS